MSKAKRRRLADFFKCNNMIRKTPSYHDKHKNDYHKEIINYL